MKYDKIHYLIEVYGPDFGEGEIVYDFLTFAEPQAAANSAAELTAKKYKHSGIITVTEEMRDEWRVDELEGRDQQLLDWARG
jgi:hypothetical protein